MLKFTSAIHYVVVFNTAALARCLGLLLAAFFLFALAGCASTKSARTDLPVVPGEVAQLHVVTVPVGLNLDNVPGPDGFSVKVFANDDTHPKAVPIKSGQLEILMFNGTFFGKTNVPVPLKTWTFYASELAAYKFDSGIGTGYEFTLRWDGAAPTERLITVGARYTSPKKQIITSLPSSVAVVNPR